MYRTLIAIIAVSLTFSSSACLADAISTEVIVSSTNPIITAPISVLPFEVSTQVGQFLQATDLIRLGSTSTFWSFVAQDWLLDLRRISLSEEMFQDNFQGKTRLFRGKALFLSHRSYQGNWIDSLPLNELSSLQVETTTGAVFTYVGKHREHPLELGHGWRDPSGIIWYEIIKNDFHLPISRTIAEATQYCQNLGTELPSIVQLSHLAEFFGARYRKGLWFDHDSSTYTYQVLPDNPYVLRSSSVVPNCPHLAYAFASDKGYAPFVGLATSTSPFRCIVAPPIAAPEAL